MLQNKRREEWLKKNPGREWEIDRYLPADDPMRITLDPRKLDPVEQVWHRIFQVAPW